MTEGSNECGRRAPALGQTGHAEARLDLQIALHPMTQVQGHPYYRENENDHNDPTGHIECVGRILCRRAANVSSLFAECQCLAEEAHGLLQELEARHLDSTALPFR